ncbi:hypothetical protein ES703_33503 [subsurface metagenome]
MNGRLRIFSVSPGSMTMAKIFISAPQAGTYKRISAINFFNQPGPARFLHFFSTGHSGISADSWFESPGLSRYLSLQPWGASLIQNFIRCQTPRVLEEYKPYLRIDCLLFGGMWAINSAMKSNASKNLKFSLKYSLNPDTVVYTETAVLPGQ